MKIRNGFVSNSSSSSFIILGSSTAPLDRVQTVELLKTNPDARILVVGASMNEGNDIFFLDRERVDFILDHEERFLASFAEWKAYVDPVKFIPDPRESWGYEGPEEDEEFLKENEQVVYKDYNSESEDDFSFFVNQYFLSSDEYSTYMDWYWGHDLGKSYLGMIIYTVKTLTFLRTGKMYTLASMSLLDMKESGCSPARSSLKETSRDSGQVSWLLKMEYVFTGISKQSRRGIRGPFILKQVTITWY